MNKQFTCLFCGHSFTPNDSHTNRPHPFCSRTCSQDYNSIIHPRKTTKDYYDKRFSVPENREKKRETDKKYAAANRERLRIKASEYYYSHHSISKKKNREYANKNKERKKEYHLANKDRIRENHRKWCAKQRHTNPLYRLHDNITSVIGSCIKKGTRYSRRTESILGYTMDKLKKHLEKQFTDGMTWENYGQWHIDHKIPISAFNFETPDDIDFKRCWSLKNLQPLWGHDNLVKNASLEKPFQPSLAIAV